MTNEALQVIAAELVQTVHNNAGTDWRRRENVHAKMRIALKKILQGRDNPPAMTADAVKTVLNQAEALLTALS